MITAGINSSHSELLWIQMVAVFCYKSLKNAHQMTCFFSGHVIYHGYFGCWTGFHFHFPLRSGYRWTRTRGRKSHLTTKRMAYFKNLSYSPFWSGWGLLWCEYIEFLSWDLTFFKCDEGRKMFILLKSPGQQHIDNRITLDLIT